MPIKSEQQRRFMAMCLHSPEKAKDKCPPKGVAKKFIHGHKRKDEMNYHYNSYFSKVISEVNYSRYDRGRHQRRDVTPEEIGAKRHHFLDTNDPAKHVGELAITRALANPQATGGNHPYASDIGQLHSLATHYERRMKDAQMYLDKHPLADKTRYKNDAHARSSFKKWGGHLHALHNDVLRAYHHANEQGHGLPKDFEGLNQSHVEEHANKRGIDISQPFDAEAFRTKVRDFARHNILVGDTNHPLYQGWKAPAKSPKGNAEEAAKQARMPQPPTREDASKDESIIMKNNSQYKKDVKALFEANLRTYDQKRVDEIFGTLAGLAWGGLKKAAQGAGKLKAGYQAAYGDRDKARETYDKADQIKPDYMSGARWDAKQIGRVVTAPKAMADRFKRNIDSRRQDPDIDAMLDRRLSGVRKAPNPTVQAQRPTASQSQRQENEFQKTKRISAEAQAKKQQSGGEATTSNNPQGGKVLNIRQFRRGRVQASTEYARLGLRALFEAILKEQEKDEDEGADDSEAPGLETPDGKSLEGGSLGRAGRFLQKNPDPEPGSSAYRAAQDALNKRLKVARKIGMGTPTGGTDSGNIKTGIRTRGK